MERGKRKNKDMCCYAVIKYFEHKLEVQQKFLSIQKFASSFIEKEKHGEEHIQVHQTCCISQI